MPVTSAGLCSCGPCSRAGSEFAGGKRHLSAVRGDVRAAFCSLKSVELEEAQKGISILVQKFEWVREREMF